MPTLLGSPASLVAEAQKSARSLSAGVHLFFDSELIAEQRNFQRVINSPARLPAPVVTAADDRCFQPYVLPVEDEVFLYYGGYECPSRRYPIILHNSRDRNGLQAGPTSSPS
jgi:hypothetical protein